MEPLTEEVEASLPSETELTLLCLDYLRDLRRSFAPSALAVQGLDADCLTLAIWALNRAFLSSHPSGNELHVNNDVWNPTTVSTIPNQHEQPRRKNGSLLLDQRLPSLAVMEREVLFFHQQNGQNQSSINHFNHEGDEKKQEDDTTMTTLTSPSAASTSANNNNSDAYSWVDDYDDTHPSNYYRFYSVCGLQPPPLLLGELIAAGLVGLAARSRAAATHDMVQSDLFQQFLQAVKEKGFFEPDNNYSESDEDANTTTSDRINSMTEEEKSALYDDRYDKVIAKFRTKLLASNVAAATHEMGDPMALAAAEQHRQARANTLTSTTYNNNRPQSSTIISKTASSAITSIYNNSNNRNNKLNTLTTIATTPQKMRVDREPTQTPILSASPSGITVHIAVEEDDDDMGAQQGLGEGENDPPTPASYVRRTALAQKLFAGGSQTTRQQQQQQQQQLRQQHSDGGSSSSGKQQQQQHQQLSSRDNHHYNAKDADCVSLQSKDSFNPSMHINSVDVDQAEKLKNAGNTYMQRKDYEKAADCYTQALKFSPNGPHSHVYFSNRAAALVSMKQYQQAISDSERSLALKPDYGKAHARLGLAHFLLGDYRQAMEAYTVALKYEPNNKSSKNYLEKAAKRLAESGGGSSSTGKNTLNNSNTMGSSSGGGQISLDSSFSLVSEWAEKSASKPPSNASLPMALSSSKKKGSGSSSVASSTKGEDKKQRMQDEREAEKYKVRGNSFMSNREYDLALQAYTQALEKSPYGSQSHVYYSNRAAALCYLERYEDAERDSLQSLSLCPSYGKAHARLGLSRFFLQDYAGAVAAYTAALKYDPDNAASRSYLLKAKAKVDSIQTATARRMMDDPEMRQLAAKVMNNTNKDGRNLMSDPAMQSMARKAITDPDIMTAMKLK